MRRTVILALLVTLFASGCGQESREEALDRCKDMAPNSVRVGVERQSGDWICVVTK